MDFRYFLEEFRLISAKMKKKSTFPHSKFWASLHNK